MLACVVLESNQLMFHFEALYIEIRLFIHTGLDERFNQMLQNMLRKFIQENKENWDTWIPAFLHTTPPVMNQHSTHLLR